MPLCVLKCHEMYTGVNDNFFRFTAILLGDFILFFLMNELLTFCILVFCDVITEHGKRFKDTACYNRLSGTFASVLWQWFVELCLMMHHLDPIGADCERKLKRVTLKMFR